MTVASNSSGSRKRGRLSRAEIKAYEARRAAERRRLSVHDNEVEASDSSSPIAHSYTITRDDEFGVIKSDLMRLGWIVGVLLIVLVVATVLLA
jgi:hypothetical protein